MKLRGRSFERTENDELPGSRAFLELLSDGLFQSAHFGVNLVQFVGENLLRLPQFDERAVDFGDFSGRLLPGRLARRLGRR